MSTEASAMSDNQPEKFSKRGSAWLITVSHTKIEPLNIIINSIVDLPGILSLIRILPLFVLRGGIMNHCLSRAT